ncbi:MAG: HEAT repeat domain-containing protein [Candidatus Manganitrophaceae bacterium]|nr:MAG: HEAT repeat domain-containing protein [Candidatus Manganitrophaceae bacterium]
MKQGIINKPIELLIRDLGDQDGMVRQRARHALTKIGEPAVDSLISAFKGKNQPAHYEAAKALSRIGSVKAIETLIRALDDEDFSVQWVAAEGLIAIGKSAIKPLLKALALHSDSNRMRAGAHHVLHDLVNRELVDGRTRKILMPVLEAYGLFGPDEYLSSVADRAWSQFEAKE